MPRQSFLQTLRIHGRRLALQVELQVEVLKVDKVGVHDNFFDLGGHSLLAMRVYNAIRPKYSTVNLSDLFKYPSIEQLGNHIDIRYGVCSTHAANTYEPLTLIKDGTQNQSPVF